MGADERGRGTDRERQKKKKQKKYEGAKGGRE